MAVQIVRMCILGDTEAASTKLDDGLRVASRSKRFGFHCDRVCKGWCKSSDYIPHTFYKI